MPQVIPHFEKVQYIAPILKTGVPKHILITGRAGSGKSNAAEGIITQYVGKKKVIDVYDDGRYENSLYGIPEDDPYLVNKMRFFMGGKWAPKSFKNELYLINGRRLRFLKKLPSICNVVSFRQEDLTEEDMIYMLGTSEANQDLLGMIFDREGILTLNQLIEKLKVRERGLGGNRWIIIRRAKRWLNSGMFSDFFDNLDMQKVLEDKDTITSFSSYLLEDETEKMLFYSMLMRKIFEAKRRHEIRHDVVVYIREVANFMGKSRRGKHYENVQNIIETILRQGRDFGVDCVADSQRMDDLPETFQSQFRYTIQMKGNLDDAKSLSKIRSIDIKYLKKIQDYGVGWGMFITPEGFEHPVIMMPARHRHKRPREDIMAYLFNRYGATDYSDKFEGID